MKIEIDWGHEKIQEFLNDEDFVFFGQEVAKLQKQKLNEDEIKSFCKTFKEKKIKELLEEVTFKKLIDFLEKEKLSIKNVFESKTLIGFDLRHFIDNKNYFVFEKKIYNSGYYQRTNDTERFVYRDQAYCCHKCYSYNEYAAEKVTLVKLKRNILEDWCEKCVKEHTAKYDREYYSVDQETLNYFNFELINGYLYEIEREEIEEEEEEEEEEETLKSLTEFQEKIIMHVCYLTIEETLKNQEEIKKIGIGEFHRRTALRILQEIEEFEEFDGFEELECFDDRAKWKSTGWIDLGSDKHEKPLAKILECLERQRYVEEE